MERLSSVVYSLLFLLSLALGDNKVGSVQPNDSGGAEQKQRAYGLQEGHTNTEANWRKEDVPSESKPSIQLYGGDIVLSELQRAILESDDPPTNTLRPKRAVVSSGTDLWPNGIVPYEMDSSLSHEAERAIAAAIEEYTVSTTCIRFRLRYASDLNYVRFHDGGGCFSQIGRSGGEQIISIGAACTTKGIVMHEIFHTLGRWHEQSRPDRDQFVEINYSNIESGYEPNFDSISQVLATTQGIPYDFDSIMHYEYNAFSENGLATIEPKDSNVAVARLGQRTGFSDLDMSHINALYCGAPAGEWSTWSVWSDCPVTCNGGTQTRTRSCINGVDCPGTNIQHRMCSEEDCPILASWSEWGAWGGCSVSCGGGRRTRLRHCLNGENCIGMRHQHSNCSTEDCPVVQRWGSWSVWSECSATCDGGTRYRTRVCTSNSVCDSPEVQREACSTNITCAPVVVEWGPCSRLCGAGGLQFRTVGNDTENRTCNEQSCHNEHCLAGVNHVGCYTLDVLDRYTMFPDPSSSSSSSSSPAQLAEPVRTCALAAARASGGHSQTLFGLSNGTCYSGLLHSQLNQSLGSDLCRNGTGGEFAVDLYEITDVFAFEASSRSIESCGADYCTGEILICSGAAKSWRVNIVLAAVLVFVCVFSCR